MDNSDKNMKINSSSLVSLKAELLRKEQEYRAERLQPKSMKPRHIKAKGDNIGKQNAGVAERNTKDLEERLKEDNEAKNSRAILEKKAKIYEAMSKGYIQDDDDNEHVLVDFHQKRHDERLDNAPAPRSRGVEIAPPGSEGYMPRSSDDRGQLPQTGPLHYANVQHNEIRTHGVGYYQFSEDDKKRQEQMDMLNKLRTQTENQKARKDRLKEKKQAMMAQRLAKMRQRRGLPEPEPEEEEADKKTESPEVTPLVRDDSWRQLAPITRDWDKGKKKDLNKSYLERRRDERLQEFAPPVAFQLDSSQGWRPTESTTSSCTTETTEETLKTESKVDTVSIEQTLKNIRTETEKLASQPPENRGPVIAEPSISKEETLVEPELGKEMEVDNIPLPPAPALEPQQPVQTEILQSSENMPSQTSGFYTEHYTQTASGEPTHVAHSENTNQTSECSAAGGYDVHTAYMSQALHDVQYLDTSQPPPNVSYPPIPAQNLPVDTTSDSLQQPQPDHVPYSTAVTSTNQEGVETVALSISSDPVQSTSQAEQGESSVVTSTTDTEETSRKRPAPQPAHYSSAPSTVKIQRPVYERVHLHQVPLTLPAPPSAVNVPQYGAQSGQFIPQKKKKEGGDKKLGPKPNKNLMHMWNTQYEYKDPSK